MKLPKYSSSLREPEIQKYWEDNDTYKEDVEDVKSNDNTYTIDLPPPTLSGEMHIGHAFSYSKGDIIARFQRMKGKKVLYKFGTDDNGIPTEHLVEKEQDVKATDMSRKEFTELCEQTVSDKVERFTRAWKKLGMSADFEDPYSTLDKNSRNISQRSFVDLYKKGYLERRKAPVAWCTETQSAVSQAEFEAKERSAFFNTIAFETTKRTVFIGTTRPELIPAAVALFAHPEDERFKDLEGEKAKIPLTGREIPILFDESVDSEKGTGIMMVSTFGDKEDVDKWKRHDLELRPIIEKNGELNELAGKYEGMKVREARTQIMEDLRSHEYVVKREKINQTVNVYERSGTPIEFLVTNQWFVKTLDAKEDLLKRGEEIEWKPSHMQKRYEDWVKNLEWDWCISRQRHFGVPVPAWYSKKTGEPILPSEEDLPIDPETSIPSTLPEGHGEEDIVADKDVLDTWFTSSVSPQIVLGLDKEGLPMNMRHMSHDIIRTWAMYTILKSHYHFDEIPWETLMVTGFIQDSNGEKMSKSKGNVVDPKRILRKYSGDALRYAAGNGKLGDDIPFKEKMMKEGDKTVQKLWNATRFVAMNIDEVSLDYKVSKLTNIDKWLLTEIHLMIDEVQEAYEEFDFPRARKAMHNTFWSVFCDNYLEISKSRVYDDDENVLKVLAYALYNMVQVMAPVLPHVTEEVYQHVYRDVIGEETIHTTTIEGGKKEYSDAHSNGEKAIEVLRLIRKHKSKNGMSLGADIEEATIEGPNVEEDLTGFEEVFTGAGGIQDVSFENSEFLNLFVPGMEEE